MKKYCVKQNSICFGNYPASSPEKAVEKAYQKVGKYYDFDFSNPFYVKKGIYEYNVMVEAPNEE